MPRPDVINKQSQVDQATHVDINLAADHAYLTIAQEWQLPSHEGVHKMRVCHRASELMVERLAERGHSAAVENRGGWTVDEHSYPVLDGAEGEEIIADPSWLQFVNSNMISKGTPKVLVGTRSQVIDTLRSHGVYDEATLALWREGK